MKNTQNSFLVRTSVIAVRSALAALVMVPVAYAAESDEVRQLTQPTSNVEMGVGYVNHSSAKFGEYNGLDKSGTYGIAGFNLQGGGSYDSDSAFRWRFSGRDLGLRTRNVDGEVGEQGKFRLTYSYDELQRNYSDQYQTFYDGAGTTAMTLPASFNASATYPNRLSATTSSRAALSNWANIQSPYATTTCAQTAGVPAGNTTNPTPANAPASNCRGPGYLIPAAMHNFDISTQRVRQNLGVNLAITPEWGFTANATHENKNGNKLTGVAFGGPARGVMAVEPINSSTDQINTAFNFIGEKSHFSIGYVGSFYRNDTNLWTVENPYQGNLLASSFNNSARLVGAPDNEMHRLSLSGGYDFTNTTRLIVNGHYQRMTQNEDFLTGLPSTWSVPTTSANAKVVNTNFNAHLTSRPVKDWALSAVYKYENRDNQTPINSYIVAGGDAANSTSTPSLFTNEPLNRQMQQVSLDADYTFARRQAVKFGYEFQEIKRTADGHETPIKAEKTKEHTLRLEYRNNLLDRINGRVAYAHSQRRASEYEENELLPADPPRTVTSPLPAADPLLPGFRQFWLADRNRDSLRSSLNFQANEALTFQTGFDYNKDNYNNSPYGLKDSTSWVFKLDGNYAASETLSYNAYYTYEDKKSQLDSATIGRGKANTTLTPHTPDGTCASFSGVTNDQEADPCRRWSETQSDKVHTFGIGVKAANLLSGKFDLGFDLSYSRSRTPIEVTGGAYFSNGALTNNNVWFPAQSFPDITTNMIDLRLNGIYRLDKSSSVRVNYLYRRLHSSDWQYDAYTNSALGVLAIPTYPGFGVTSPNYSVQAIGVSYIYSFQ